MDHKKLVSDLRAYAEWADANEYDVPLGMQDSNFSRKLRFELPHEEKGKILEIIDRLAQEKQPKPGTGMEDEKLIEILYRDGYHAAARRMEELLNLERMIDE